MARLMAEMTCILLTGYPASCMHASHSIVPFGTTNRTNPIEPWPTKAATTLGMFLPYRHRLALSLVLALVLHGGGVFVSCDDEFQSGSPFDEGGDALEECNDDTIICEVSKGAFILCRRSRIL